MAELLSVAEAAQRLDVSPRRVRQLIDQGELDASRIGKLWLVHAGSVERRRSQPVVAGRPLDSHRIWSISLVADQLVEQFAHEMGGMGAEGLLRREEAGLTQRLAEPLRFLSGVESDRVEGDREYRAEVERALQDALGALRDHKRRENVAKSPAASVFGLQGWNETGDRMSPSEQLELLSPGSRDDPAAIRRLRDSLAHERGIGPEVLAPYRHRSEGIEGFYSHPSTIASLRDDERLLLSGAQAAYRYGTDLVPGDGVEAYLDAGCLSGVIDHYGLESVPLEQANLWLRPVAELNLRGVLAPRLLVAADLLERRDPRERAAAFQLLEVLAAAIRWHEE